MFKKGCLQKLIDVYEAHIIYQYQLEYLQNVYIYILDYKTIFFILKIKRRLFYMSFVVWNTFVLPCR
jgi:hypothetical protein